MIATRKGLAILAAIAALLAVVLVVDLVRRRGPESRALVPGFDEASAVRLAWTAHPVGPYLTLERSKGGPWKRTVPTPGAIEQTPVASLLAALRGARWHRSETRDVRSDAAANLVVDGAQPLELWIGRMPVDAEQAWIGIGDRAYLVDAWVVRALLPLTLDLAITTPLAGIPNVPDFTVDGVRIEGSPRRLAEPPLVLDPAFATELERALVELAIDNLPPRPMGDANALRITMAGTQVALGGACEQRVYLAASTGDGCVPRAKADAVTAVVARLHGPPAAIAARSPVPVGVERIALVDGEVLDLRRRPRIGADDADPAQVATLMAVLRAPVELADVVPAPSTPVRATLAITTTHDGIVLELHAGNLVRRGGEAIALRLSPEAFAILERPASAYKDATPWREDPTTIDEITIDRTTWKRGAVLGEWVSTPPATASDARSIETLVQALAVPGVVGVGPTTFATTHRVRLVVRPPTGETIVHELEVGAPTSAGCPARANRSTILLSMEVCRLVAR